MPYVCSESLVGYRVAPVERLDDRGIAQGGQLVPSPFQPFLVLRGIFAPDHSSTLSIALIFFTLLRDSWTAV
jgi:hypothetical protein